MISSPISLIKFRLATHVDLPALEWNGEFTHFRQLFNDTFRQVTEMCALMWVIECHNSGIIGQIFVQLNGHRTELADGVSRAYLYAFRVRPQYRNKGIGTRLMEVVETDLVKREYHSVTINVARDNLGARRLYERLGYRVVVAEPGEWSYIDHLGQRQYVHEPAWRMEKDI